MRWEGHVASMEESRCAYKVLVWRPDGKNPLGRRMRRWKKILKWIFKKWDWEAWTGLIWLKIGTGGGPL